MSEIKKVRPIKVEQSGAGSIGVNYGTITFIVRDKDGNQVGKDLVARIENLSRVTSQNIRRQREAVCAMMESLGAKVVDNGEITREHTTREAEATRTLVESKLDWLLRQILNMTQNPEAKLQDKKVSKDKPSASDTAINSPRSRGVRILAYTGVLLLSTALMGLGITGFFKHLPDIEDQRITQAEIRAEHREWHTKNAVIMRQENEPQPQWESRQKKWREHGDERLGMMKSFATRERIAKDIITLDYQIISGFVLLVLLGYMGAKYAQVQMQILQKAETEHGPANAEAVRDFLRKLWPFRRAARYTRQMPGIHPAEPR